MGAGFSQGRFCWADLMSADQAKAIDFYASFAGWAIEQPNPEQFDGYVLATLTDGGTTAGIHGRTDSGDPKWFPYLAVDDIDATVARVEELGGTVLLEPFQAGPAGRGAYLAEPSGAKIALWQGGELPGFAAQGVPGTLSWAEVYSGDAAATRDFFVELLGLTSRTIEESDEFTYYQLLDSTGAMAFGVMAIGDLWPDGTQPHTGIYLSVLDVDAEVQRAEQLGAAVIDAPSDQPYGRTATLRDPGSAEIKIVDFTTATGLPAS